MVNTGVAFKSSLKIYQLQVTNGHYITIWIV